MDHRLDELAGRLRALEEEFEREIDARRARFRYSVARGRVVFEAEVRREHTRLRKKTLAFLRDSPVGSLAIAPFVYGLVLPLLLLDAAIWLYQQVCFRVWGIAGVKRAEYVVLDRHHLGYLNGVQKLNCLYCSYANGLVAYVQEVAARTEQYWCPIKHAIRIKATHRRYRDFAEYGDAAAFRGRLNKLRRDLRAKRNA